MLGMANFKIVDCFIACITIWNVSWLIIVYNFILSTFKTNLICLVVYIIIVFYTMVYCNMFELAYKSVSYSTS